MKNKRYSTILNILYCSKYAPVNKGVLEMSSADVVWSVSSGSEQHLSNDTFQKVGSVNSDLGVLLNGRVGNQICQLNY